MVKDYFLGLSVSNGKIGYAAVDHNNDLVRVPANHRLGISKSKLALGLANFEPGQPAQERRVFRTGRRGTSRTKMRVRYWKKIFEPEIVKETGDDEFFERMEKSWMSPLDERKKIPTGAAVKITEDTYKHFPTVYHLRKWLMETNEKADLRYIAMAVHNIIVYPGNFLSKLPPSSYASSKLNVKEEIEAINEAMADLNAKISFDTDYDDQIEAVLKDRRQPTKKKSDLLYDLLYVECDNKKQAKTNKKKTQALIKAILGNPFQLDVLLDKDVLDAAPWKITLKSDAADEAIDAIRPELTDSEEKIISHICNIYNANMLSFIVEDGQSISQSMVKKYDEYGRQLSLLKKYAKQCGGKKRRQIKDLYSVYCANPRYLTKNLKKRTKNVANDNAMFAAEIKNIIEKDEEHKELSTAKEILDLIESGSFLIKLHNKENRVIPYQINELELNAILENQGKYYPFLIRKNPVVNNDKWVRRHPYELDQLLAFRIPYFVGPLVTPEEQAKNSPNKSGQIYAWMVRREEGKITPWNFWQKVDLGKTAEAFIQRMVKTDSVLLEEKVLPDNSLLYQEFKVLDELNKVKVNNRPLTPWQKDLAMGMFKKYKTVSKDRFIKELSKKGSFGKPMVVSSVDGLSNPKKFNNGLSTYIDFKKIFGDKIDEKGLRDDFERMVYWITIFDDDDILQEKLSSISWMTDVERKKVMRKHYAGWGRYSRTTLTALLDDHGKSIIQKMREKSLLVNQCLADPEVKAKIEEHNEKIASQEDVEQILQAAYASPSVKKIVRQTLKVVDDVICCTNAAPKYFALSSLRQASEERQLAMKRQDKLKKIIKKSYASQGNKKGKGKGKANAGLIDKKLLEELKAATKGKRRLSDKEFLFFSQLGRDFFTGERIPYDQIRYCIISHAADPGLYHDDSMSNKVLIAPKTAGMVKSKPARMAQFGGKPCRDLGASTVAGYWFALKNMEIMPKSKLYLLYLDENDMDYRKKLSYVNRSFVERSQAVKILSLVLKAKYPDADVIQVRSEFVNDVRKAFDIYRSYMVNDHYVATDAYINGLLGNYFLQVYPKLKPFFVYGKHMYAESREQAKELGELSRMNLTWRLTTGFKNDDAVYRSETNVAVFSREEIKRKLRRVDELKHINISYESMTGLGNLFNREVVYPSPLHDTANTRSLICKKKNMPTEQYGGYSYLATAMLAIIRIKNKRGVYVNQYVKIPTIAVASVAQDRKKNPKAFRQAVRKYLTSTVEGPFEILCYGLNLQTHIRDGQKDYYVRSDNRGFDARQLMLSQKSRRIIQDLIEDPDYRMHAYAPHREDAKKELTSVYLEILDQLKGHWELWETASFKNKILNSQNAFEELDYAKKKAVVYALLTDLQANSKFIQFKDTLNLSLVSLGPNKTVSDDAEIIYASASGMRTRIRKIYDPLDKSANVK